MNARFTGKGSDGQIDQSAVEMRANRLAEIKKELSQMLNRPEDPAVWWEKGGTAKPGSLAMRQQFAFGEILRRGLRAAPFVLPSVVALVLALQKSQSNA